MTFLTRASGGLAAALLLSACAATPGEDYGFDSGKLSDLKATIWVDPLGCQHWIISDGAEGYLSSRLNRDGTPVCPDAASLGTARNTDDIPRFEQDATLWTDPNGCEHWVSDHGASGFMSQRIDRAGRPVCPGRQASAPAQTITLGADALFDTNKSDLKPEAIAELDEFGQKAKTLGKKRLFIVGHTDSRASDAYNQSLSERRAKAVARYLQQTYGLVSQTEGQGESAPVASNDTVEGRQSNRRVEITVLD